MKIIRTPLNIKNDDEFEIIKKLVIEELEHRKEDIMVCSRCNTIDQALNILFGNETVSQQE